MLKPLLIGLLCFIATPNRLWAQASVDPAIVLAQDIAAATAKFRGLALKHPVDTKTYSVDELKDFVRASFDKDLPVEKCQVIETNYKAFGLLPPTYSLRESLMELLFEQIGGFYDPDAKQLRIIARKEGDAKSTFGVSTEDMDRMVMAHELVHALQDQHFDLNSFPLEVSGNDDLAAASQALIEGDATVSMLGVQSGSRFNADGLFKSRLMISATLRLMGPSVMSQGPGMEQFKKAPRYLADSLMFPYLSGLDFCLAAGAEDRGFAGVDAMFRRPPLSTEHILHPDRWISETRDYPQVIALPPSLAAKFGAKYRALESNVFGEFGVRQVLHEALGKARSSAAAKGWDGDRYQVFVGDDLPQIIVWVTVWDDSSEADGFIEAAKTWIEHRHPEATAETVDWAPAVYAHGDDRRQLLGRRGSLVVYLGGIPKDLAVTALKLILEETTSTELTAIPKAESKPR